MSQAFVAQPLDLTIDFTNADKSRIRLITGKGKMIYWRGCNVSVIETDNEGKESTMPLYGMPNGQGVAAAGTKLYIVNGEVKED
jgi:hypothetical protein